VFTPPELVNRIVQLVPPPRTHRHCYYRLLAPNSPLRAAVTAMAQAELPVPVPPAQVIVSCPVVVPLGTGAPIEPPAKPKPRPPSHCLWAALIARICEVFQLLCPMCGGLMRIIAFITFSADVHKILEHIGVDAEAPRIAPARGPPLWVESGAQETSEGVEALPDWDLANQSPPAHHADQRTTWRTSQVWRHQSAGIGLCRWAASAVHCGAGGTSSWKIRLANVDALFCEAGLRGRFWVRYPGSCGWISYPLSVGGG
jgi:hypothetical protein